MSVSSAAAATVTELAEDAAWSFNVSFSLLNFGSLFQYPSMLLDHLRKLDDMANHQDVSQAPGGLSSSSALARRMRGETGPPPPSGFTPMPGPWSFFASGYAVTLFAMALLLNRIQNIVVPSRHTSPYLHDNPNRFSFLRSIYPSIFPIDLSSTYSRTILRVPSLYFLLKALALWSVILLQGAGYFPSVSWSFVRSLDAWASAKDMEDVCWFTLLAVCGALCVGALTRGLEGVGPANTSPFHLFGYAFLLHLYASPITHTVKLEGLPTRPDIHVIIAIIMPLLQLSIIHTLGVKRTWSQQRLIPTTLCSVLTLVHFHSVLWTSPSSYPLINYTSCIFESFLIVVTALAFLLNALAQLLLEGAVPRPFFGHADTLMPKWDEDFSIVLLRLGTASLETTNVAGLGNEVSGVPLSKSSAKLGKATYGEVQMNRAGVTSVSHPADGAGSRGKKDGFGNEIRSVRVTTASADSWPDMVWYRELGRFADGVVRLARRWGGSIWRLFRGQPIPLPLPTEPSAPNMVSDIPGPQLDSDNVYRQFLAGESVSDDDDDFDPNSPSRAPGHDETDLDTDDEGDDGGVDAAGLYADLSMSAVSSAVAPTAPLLLAHMTDASTFPLTRRRYSRLVSQPGRPQDRNEEAEWDNFVGDRRAIASANEKGQAGQESRRNCVICTVEERQIICWPCRCLALCNDCRENLASRFSASKHTCPCCRQPVEGFSRIYIP